MVYGILSGIGNRKN